MPLSAADAQPSPGSQAGSGTPAWLPFDEPVTDPVDLMEYVERVQWHLLAGIPPEEVRLLLSYGRRRRFDRGEVVFHQDDPGDSLHLITSGRFAIRVRTPLGQTVTVGLRATGSNFGEMALVEEGARRSATVAALEPSETFAIYQEDFNQLRARHPETNQILLALLAGEIRRLNERLLEAFYLPVEKRVLRRLAELGAIYGPSADGVVDVPLTQEEIAEFAGAVRGTVNRVLREEQQHGTIELRRGGTRLLDVEAIVRRAR
jgi:CRP/FNR family transcriptional regulator, cyclic AMP receptor protein